MGLKLATLFIASVNFGVVVIFVFWGIFVLIERFEGRVLKDVTCLFFFRNIRIVSIRLIRSFSGRLFFI